MTPLSSFLFGLLFPVVAGTLITGFVLLTEKNPVDKVWFALGAFNLLAVMIIGFSVLAALAATK